jgi:hypothetical protein
LDSGSAGRGASPGAAGVSGGGVVGNGGDLIDDATLRRTFLSSGEEVVGSGGYQGQVEDVDDLRVDKVSLGTLGAGTMVG